MIWVSDLAAEPGELCLTQISYEFFQVIFLLTLLGSTLNNLAISELFRLRSM